MIPNSAPAKPARKPVIEVARYFLKLGLLGFGGPLALVGNMQRDLIEKRGWMDPDGFARAFALIKAMPGPVAFQAAVFLGRHRAGWRGGLVAALALNGPAFIMMVVFGMFYEKWRHAAGGPEFMAGMQAAALGVILATSKSLGYAHRFKPVFWILALFAFAATFHMPSMEPLLIVSSGALTALFFVWRSAREPGKLPAWLRDLRLALIPFDPRRFFFGNAEAFAALSSQPNLIDLSWNCFKSGAFVFGSGLAIVPLMEHDFVRTLGWLSHREFMDALAFGQITPGPVVITATFIGYKSLGLVGAVVGTCAIFSAPFFHMMTWFPRFNDRLSNMSWISAFLTGAIAAVVGSILATTIQLASALDHKNVTLPILAATLAAGLFTKVPAWLMIPLGGAASFLIGGLV